MIPYSDILCVFGGFELRSSYLHSKCSNPLSYIPDLDYLFKNMKFLKTLFMCPKKVMLKIAEAIYCQQIKFIAIYHNVNKV